LAYLTGRNRVEFSERAAIQQSTVFRMSNPLFFPLSHFNRLARTKQTGLLDGRNARTRAAAPADLAGELSAIGAGRRFRELGPVETPAIRW
jgi:hypothetical protein